MGFFSKLFGKTPVNVVSFDHDGVHYVNADGRKNTMLWRDLQSVKIIRKEISLPHEFMFWVLSGKGVSCTVPNDASGMAAVLDRLQQLPNFQHEMVISAVSSGSAGSFECWQRPKAAQPGGNTPAAAPFGAGPSGPADENTRCQEMLDNFFHGRPLAGGLAYQTELSNLTLDFSRASLERLDRLLLSLRQSAPADHQTFIDQKANNNFLRLLGYYLAVTIARAGNLPIKWFDYDQTRAWINEPLPRQFETEHSCAIGSRLYFPMGLLTEILFDVECRTCAGYAEQILASNTSNLFSIRRPRLSAADSLPPLWSGAIRDAGFLAAFAMFMIEGGSTMVPTILKPKDGKTELAQLVNDLIQPDLQEALQRGDRQINSNPDGLPYMAYVYDGFANLPTGRKDALVIELRCYQQPALKATLCLPYQHAHSPLGFGIFSPKIIEHGFSELQLADFAQVFYQGVDKFKNDKFVWDDYLDESV